LVLVVAGVLALFVPAVIAASRAGRPHHFAGLNRPGLANVGSFVAGNPKPDSTGAIGPRHFVQAVNSRFAVYKRKGLRRVSVLVANRFFHVTSLSAKFHDPQVAWDAQSRRWYASMFLNDGARGNALAFAWSKTADPSDLAGGWCTFRIHTGKLAPDYPMLGFDRKHLVVAANMGDLDRRQLRHARLWAIAKPTAKQRSCRRPAVKPFGKSRLRLADGNLATSLVPAKPVSASGGAWIFASDCIGTPKHNPCRRPDPRGRQFTVWHLTGSRASPRLVRAGAIHVRPYALASPVRQAGKKQRLLDAGDARFSQAVTNTDPTRGIGQAVWIQHTVRGSGGRSVIRWYELAPRRLAVIRSGTVAARRKWAIYGAISPTSRGNAALITYERAGGRTRPQIRARRLGPWGGARRGVRDLFLGGSSGHLSHCDGICPWGDYAAASADPRRPDVVWGTNQSMRRAPAHAKPLVRSFPWRTRNFAIPIPGGG
jgi:hypothetical protein